MHSLIENGKNMTSNSDKILLRDRLRSLTKPSNIRCVRVL